MIFRGTYVLKYINKNVYNFYKGNKFQRLIFCALFLCFIKFTLRSAESTQWFLVHGHVKILKYVIGVNDVSFWFMSFFVVL